MNINLKYILGSLLILFFLCCCCMCFASLALFGIFAEAYYPGISVVEPTEIVVTPTEIVVMPTPPTIEEENSSELNYLNLKNTFVNFFDVTDAAKMFHGLIDIPEFLIDEGAPFDVGDSHNFELIDTDTNEMFVAETTLQYETDHVYFWIEDSVSFDEDDLAELVEAFENEIYPINRNFFGNEFFPGIDNDEHIFIIFAGGIGENVAGLFSSSDSIHPIAMDYSNGHEVFYVNSDNQSLASDYIYGVLAHEFQHMIHWNLDRNETGWLNEGFSELAVILNDSDVGYFDSIFLRNPDMQLNTWTDDDTSSAHYGASLLFTSYFYDRFGEESTRALVEHEENGLVSIDSVLDDLGVIDQLTGERINADNMILDWAIANYLQDSNVGDGRYDYELFEPTNKASIDNVGDCLNLEESRTVHQYGTDYLNIECDEDQTIHFSGGQLVDLLPQSAYSGNYAFWTNQGDDSLMTLTKEFDFSEIEGNLNFVYRIWYDIEKDYDYLYLVVSTDGENWEIIDTPSGTDEDPTGANYGWGYNGFSGDDGIWIKENVDLSEFAGQKITVGFMYLTDAGVNGEGALIDDVSVIQIGYFEDFEDGAGDWQADGFALVSDSLPQTFEIALIRFGTQTEVEILQLSETNEVEFDVAADERVVIVIMGTTRFTHQNAVYTFEIVE